MPTGVYRQDENTARASVSQQPTGSQEPAGLPPGTIQVTPDRQQLIGVRYGVAEMTSGAGTLRAVGKVALDETRISRVHSKIEGWIEKVNIDFIAAPVKAGQPLLTIYSPEMLSSQQELLLAMKAREMTHDSTVREAFVNNEALIDAARKRLALWDLSQAQIDQVQQDRRPIHSDRAVFARQRFAAERNASPNCARHPETQLYAIADLDRVWIMADAFETDLTKIRVGQSATITLPYATARAFTATVNYIQPQVDPNTRTLKIRLDAANPGLRIEARYVRERGFPARRVYARHGARRMRCWIPEHARRFSWIAATDIWSLARSRSEIARAIASKSPAA